MTRAQIKKKVAANAAASASSAPSASRSAPLTEKEKHKAEQALVKQNIEKSIQALAKEAIHVSATPTRLEDAEIYYQSMVAATKEMQAAHKLEQAQIAAAQAAADALEPSNDELLGLAPEEAQGETDSPLDTRGYLKRGGEISILPPRLQQICAEDDLFKPSVDAKVKTKKASDTGKAEADAESDPEADADGDDNANNNDDDKPPDESDDDNDGNVDDFNDTGGDGGNPDSSSDESDASSGDGDDDGNDNSDDDEAKAEVEVEDDEEVEPEKSKPKDKKSLKIKPLAKKKSPKAGPKPAPKDKKVKTKTDAKTGKTHRAQKAENSEEDSPPQRKAGLQTSIINMKEAYYLTREKLLDDADKAARAFYEQAYRPGMLTSWEMLIEMDAIQTIRDQLLRCKSATGYSTKTCLAWPTVNGKTLTLKKIANDLRKIFDKNKRTSSHFDFEMKSK